MEKQLIFVLADISRNNSDEYDMLIDRLDFLCVKFSSIDWMNLSHIINKRHMQIYIVSKLLQLNKTQNLVTSIVDKYKISWGEISQFLISNNGMLALNLYMWRILNMEEEPFTQKDMIDAYPNYKKYILLRYNLFVDMGYTPGIADCISDWLL